MTRATRRALLLAAPALLPLRGARAAALEDARRQVVDMATSALLALHADAPLLSYGELAEVNLVASVRKSLLSMLYGRPAAEGRIALQATLGSLGIDDVGGLLPVEKTARVMHLLTTRSGVYHAPSNPQGDDHASAPPRGSQTPGSYFLYNNWDFDAAGTVYEQATGRSLYDAFEQELARPLGLQDFDRAQHRRMGDAAVSQHLSYPFFLSARDMARLGQLMAAGGVWQGQALVPARWVAESTALVTPSAEMHPPATARRGIGYGYLWWVLEEPAASPLHGGFMAWGQYGQFILVVPARRLVVAHQRRIFRVGNARMRQVTGAEFLTLARLLAQASG